MGNHRGFFVFKHRLVSESLPMQSGQMGSVMNRKRILTALLALLLCFTDMGLVHLAAADDQAIRSALQKWMDTAAKVETVQAEFEQHRLLSTVKIPLKRQGKIWMDKSGLFRWQIGEPPTMTVLRDATGSLTVLDGKEKTARVWSKEALLAQEAEGKGQGFAMLSSMQSPSMEDFEKRFDIKGGEPTKENAAIWRFDLALKDRQASVFVRQIQLTVNVDEGTLQSMVILMRDKSSLGTYVRSYRLNGKIPADVFKVDTTGYELEKQ